MSQRIFVTVERGPMDKTAVCVFPWEVQILQLIHGGNIKVTSIEEMSALGEGVIKVEKQKLKHTKSYAPGLREQLEIMAWVDPEQDPANDPDAEYMRLAEKYGMDKEMPVAVVTRIYGELSSGNFAKVLEPHRKPATKPRALVAAESGLSRAPRLMTTAELREALDERHIEWSAKMSKGQLIDLLEKSLDAEEAPA